jgi:hypothetical protein
MLIAIRWMQAYRFLIAVPGTCFACPLCNVKSNRYASSIILRSTRKLFTNRLLADIFKTPSKGQTSAKYPFTNPEYSQGTPDDSVEIERLYLGHFCLRRMSNA